VALLHAATHHLRRARRKPPRARVSPARPFSQAIPSLTHRDVACSALELGSDSDAHARDARRCGVHQSVASP
jgi:hypothetical protein